MIVTTAVLIVGAAVWGLLVTRHFTHRDSTGRLPSSTFAVAISVVVGAILWWSYLRATDPSITAPADLLRAHYIYAGGAAVPTVQYLTFLFSVIGLAVLFVLVGHFICRQSGFLGVAEFAPIDAGVYFVVGLAAFLSLLVCLSTITLDVRRSAIAIVIVFAALSAQTLRARDVWVRLRERAGSQAGTLLLMTPALVCGLCLLQFVVTKRWNAIYDDFALQIARSHVLPLINRHFGQSLLASVGLMAFGAGAEQFTFARVLLNNWLYVSQIALVLVLFRFLRELTVTPAGSVIGVVILMLGGSALSLLPHIIYDHDNPLIMNIYADSVVGIAGFLVIVLYLVRLPRAPGDAARLSWRPAALVVPAVIMIAFNYTAELNAVIVLAMLVVLALANPFFRFLTWPHWATIVVVLSLATLVGAQGGGVFSARFASEASKRDSPFFERDASNSRMSMMHARWWYLPHVMPGFETGFGNLPVPNVLLTHGPVANPEGEAAAAYADSSNAKLIAKFQQDKARWSRFSNLIYLVELRGVQMIQDLWFPLIGVLGLGLYLRTSTDGSTPAGVLPDGAKLSLFWIVTASSFLGAVAIVFFTNAVDGNAVFWKWALTRFLEPGLCLATVAFVVVLERVIGRGDWPMRRYATWFAVVLFMSFSTLYRIFCFDS